jgi:hypothetical protein
MISEEERRALWERHTALLGCPPMDQEGMSGADEQALRGISSRVERLLEYEAVLPAGLTAMLADYRRDLAAGADGRWEGTGLLSRVLGLAERLGRAIAEGRWKPGERVHDEDYDYLLAEPPGSRPRRRSWRPGARSRSGLMATTSGAVMTAPGREEAEAITWHIDGLLADGYLLPPALAAALRAYREHLLAHCARQPWARPGNRARYARLADAFHGSIIDGTWRPGDRLPWLPRLEQAHGGQAKTVWHALFLLLVRGHLARDRLTYYVPPPALDPASQIDGHGRDKS